MKHPNPPSRRERLFEMLKDHRPGFLAEYEANLEELESLNNLAERREKVLTKMYDIFNRHSIILSSTQIGAVFLPIVRLQLQIALCEVQLEFSRAYGEPTSYIKRKIADLTEREDEIISLYKKGAQDVG